MIRPATCLAMLLAAGSGLYLYQSKHQAYVLDQQIDTVTHETGKIHAHIAVLRAEYALMNDPSRLQTLAATYLPTLAPPTPGQFTTLAELDARLPAVAPPPAARPAVAPDAAPGDPAPGLPGVVTGHALYDYPPAPAAGPVPAVVASLAAPTEAPPAVTAVHAITPNPASAPARRPRPTSYASLTRSPPRRAALPATFARPDPLAFQAAAPPLPALPASGGSVLGMAHMPAAPAYATYQRYQPGGAETFSR